MTFGHEGGGWMNADQRGGHADPSTKEPPIKQVRAELQAAGIDTGPATERVLLAVSVARLRNPRPAEAYPGPCEMHEQPAQRSADMARVVAAYLAAHPADDGEPVTEEWLRAVGFRPLKSFAWGLVHHDKETDIRFRLRCEDMPNVATECAWSMESLYYDRGTSVSNREASLLPCSPTTRGAVRRLCAALGVPLRPTEGE